MYKIRGSFLEGIAILPAHPNTTDLSVHAKGLSAPRIVAIETSGRLGSVALAQGGAVLAARQLAPELRHAVELMPVIRALMVAQGWAMQANGSSKVDGAGAQLDEVYLSLGPGSFTGLRIAVAIARAMAQAAGCRIVGVPSLDVIAQNAPLEFRVVVPVLDAKRGQVFAARYERNAEGTLVRSAGPGLVDPAGFVAEAMGRAKGSKIALLGEGVDYHRETLLAASVVELDRALWTPQAVVVHRLGWQQAQRGGYSDPQTLLPIYIRLPEAEEVWRKKRGLPLH